MNNDPLNDEQPTPQFRGILVRPEFFDLVEYGIISASDAWLLLVIDSYVNWKDGGCFVTNKALAAGTGKLPRQICNQLRTLKELNLISITYQNNQRRIALNPTGVMTALRNQRSDA